jgi:hypothetical protein
MNSTSTYLKDNCGICFWFIFSQKPKKCSCKLLYVTRFCP